MTPKVDWKIKFLQWTGHSKVPVFATRVHRWFDLQQIFKKIHFYCYTRMYSVFGVCSSNPKANFWHNSFMTPQWLMCVCGLLSVWCIIMGDNCFKRLLLLNREWNWFVVGLLKMTKHSKYCTRTTNSKRW